jgi:hypothetical protein
MTLPASLIPLIIVPLFSFSVILYKVWNTALESISNFLSPQETNSARWNAFQWWLMTLLEVPFLAAMWQASDPQKEEAPSVYKRCVKQWHLLPMYELILKRNKLENKRNWIPYWTLRWSCLDASGSSQYFPSPLHPGRLYDSSRIQNALSDGHDHISRLSHNTKLLSYRLLFTTEGVLLYKASRPLRPFSDLLCVPIWLLTMPYSSTRPPRTTKLLL